MSQLMTGAIIITGSSCGIGAATATLASQRNYAVYVNYRSNERAAQQIVETIRSRGGRAVAVQADVSIESDVVRLFDSCEEAFGQPRALVNNAGILETQMRFELMQLDRWHRVLATNVMGSFLCAREAVRRLSTRHGGAGGLAKEVATEGIRVNAVRAGFIYTDTHVSGGEPEHVGRLKETVPMKRGGTAEEVAEVIMWLLSDSASYVTGSIIDVTGGK